jgi:hypothetical protein
MNSDELREAHKNAQPDVVKATTRLGQSSAIYRALERIKTQQGEEGAILDEVQVRILNAELNAMKLSGVGLEGEAKDQFNKNKVRLSELCNTYQFLLSSFKIYSFVVVVTMLFVAILLTRHHHHLFFLFSFFFQCINSNYFLEQCLGCNEGFHHHLQRQGRSGRFTSLCLGVGIDSLQ